MLGRRACVSGAPRIACASATDASAGTDPGSGARPDPTGPVVPSVTLANHPGALPAAWTASRSARSPAGSIQLPAGNGRRPRPQPPVGRLVRAARRGVRLVVPPQRRRCVGGDVPAGNRLDRRPDGVRSSLEQQVQRPTRRRKRARPERRWRRRRRARPAKTPPTAAPTPARGRHAHLGRLAAGAVVADPPSVCLGMRAQARVGVDRAGFSDELEHRDVVGRVRSGVAPGQVQSLVVGQDSDRVPPWPPRAGARRPGVRCRRRRRSRPPCPARRRARGGVR